jgi:Holliday junction resolvase RusA-like endonuclease
MSYSLDLEIKGVPKILANMRGGWKALHFEKKKWKDRTHREVILNRMVPATALLKANVRLTRYTSRCPDADNLYSSWKGVLDGLVEAGVIKDDSPHVINLVCDWQKTSNRLAKIRIQVQELTQCETAQK